MKKNQKPRQYSLQNGKSHESVKWRRVEGGKDLWNRFALSPQVKKWGVMDDERG